MCVRMRRYIHISVAPAATHADLILTAEHEPERGILYEKSKTASGQSWGFAFYLSQTLYAQCSSQPHSHVQFLPLLLVVIKLYFCWSICAWVSASCVFCGWPWPVPNVCSSRWSLSSMHAWCGCVMEVTALFRSMKKSSLGNIIVRGKANRCLAHIESQMWQCANRNTGLV